MSLVALSSAAGLGAAGLGAIAVLWMALRSAVRSAGTRHNPFDTRRMRREMLASAKDEQERDYLRELDALELHRRHLVC